MAKDGLRHGRAPRPFLLLWLYYTMGYFAAVSILSVVGGFLLPRWVFLPLTLFADMGFTILRSVMSYGCETKCQWSLMLINSALYGAALAGLHVAAKK